MLLFHLLVNLPWALGATLAAGSARGDELQLLSDALQSKEAEAKTSILTGRDSSTGVLQRRTQVLQNSTTISKSWQNALLYRHIP
jgi:hypothetical protein